MSKSNDLKELLEEAVAGIPSIGNPFADRKKANYESKFETFLAEADTDAKRADDAKRLGKKVKKIFLVLVLKKEKKLKLLK